MILTRGIKYYTIEDISSALFKTPDSKQLESLMENGFDPGAVHQIPHLDLKTDHLSLFTGNFLIRLIPKKAIWTYMKIQEMQSSGISSEPQTFPDRDIYKISNKIEAIYEELVNLMQDISGDMVTRKNYENVPCYILGYMATEDKALKFVRSGQLDLIEQYLTDARVYALEDGEQRYEDDGIPMDIFYKYEANEDVPTYSKEAKPEYRRVGT